MSEIFTVFIRAIEESQQGMIPFLIVTLLYVVTVGAGGYFFYKVCQSFQQVIQEKNDKIVSLTNRYHQDLNNIRTTLVRILDRLEMETKKDKGS